MTANTTPLVLDPNALQLREVREPDGATMVRDMILRSLPMLLDEARAGVPVNLEFGPFRATMTAGPGAMTVAIGGQNVSVPETTDIPSFLQLLRLCDPATTVIFADPAKRRLVAVPRYAELFKATPPSPNVETFALGLMERIVKTQYQPIVFTASRHQAWSKWLESFDAWQEPTELGPALSSPATGALDAVGVVAAKKATATDPKRLEFITAKLAEIEQISRDARAATAGEAPPSQADAGVLNRLAKVFGGGGVGKAVALGVEDVKKIIDEVYASEPKDDEDDEIRPDPPVDRKRLMRYLRRIERTNRILSTEGVDPETEVFEASPDFKLPAAIMISVSIIDGGHPMTLPCLLNERILDDGRKELKLVTAEPVAKIEERAFKDLMSQVRDQSGAMVVAGSYVPA